MVQNILLFPAGSLVAQEIYDALKYEKNLKIFATGADEHNYATLYFKNYIPNCPMISDEEAAVEFLRNCIETHRIQYLYPAFDAVFPFLAKHKARLPCELILPSAETIDICNSKRKTYELFSSLLRVPMQYSKESFQLPVYVKPAIGYGSRNHKLLRNASEINTIDTSENLLLEYLPGKEFTVDCFTNASNQLIYCNARERLRTANGLAVTSETVTLPGVHQFGSIISSKLQMRGAWFFQVKYTGNHELCLLEIACRIPGSMCTSRMTGINFPLLTLLDRQKIPIDSILQKDITIKSFKVYRTLYKTTLPSFTAVYCDLDDTLILNNEVNVDLVRLLYKFRNERKKLVLLTRNKAPNDILDAWKLQIFDEIYSLPSREQKKSQYIQSKDSIFIDDSYSERREVFEQIGCPTFSPSEMELFN